MNMNKISELGLAALLGTCTSLAMAQNLPTYSAAQSAPVVAIVSPGLNVFGKPADDPFARPLVAGFETPQLRASAGQQYGLSASTTDFELPIGALIGTRQLPSERLGGNRLSPALRLDSGLGKGFSFSGQLALDPVSASQTTASSIAAGLHFQDQGFSTGLVLSRNTYVEPSVSLNYVQDLPRFTYPLTAGHGSLARSLVPNLDGSLLGVNSQTKLALGARYAMGKLSLIGDISEAAIQGNNDSSRLQVVELGGIYHWTPAIYTSLGFQKARLEDISWNQIGGSIRYNWSTDTILFVSGDFLKAANGTVAPFGSNYGATQYDVKFGVNVKF